MKEPFPDAIDQRMVRSLAHPPANPDPRDPHRPRGEPERPCQPARCGSRRRRLPHAGARPLRSACQLVDTAQRRGATEHFYKATPGAFVGGPHWRKVPRAVRGGVWAATLQTFLDKAIAALEAGTLDGRDDTVFRWMPLHLDEEGFEEVVAILEEATKLMLAAHVRSQDRLSENGGEDTVSTVVGMAAFETAGSLEAA